MSKLEELDAINSNIAEKLFLSAPMRGWTQITLVAKYTPNGLVSVHRYQYQLDTGSIDRGSAPNGDAEDQIVALTDKHRQATDSLRLPQWYKMTVRVERNGSFECKLEYKDDYVDGDIGRDD